MESKFSKLKSGFSVSNNWEEPELFHENIKINSLELKMVGISSKNKNYSGVFATGSASSDLEFPLERAYFEFLERAYLIDQKNAINETFSIINSECEIKQYLSNEEVFKIEKNSSWKLALSNGVAIHTGLKDAMKSAKNELLERHILLNSWYEQNPPIILNQNVLNDWEVSTLLSDIYTFYVCSFCDENFHCIGVFAFPKDEKRFSIFGFAANDNFDIALHKAKMEFIQRLSFLWDAESEYETTKFEPSALYHQEYYLIKDHEKFIRKWLFEGQNKSIGDMSNLDIKYVDLTPYELKGRLFLLKAFSKETTPLIFGKNYSIKGKTVTDEHAIHPIC